MGNSPIEVRVARGEDAHVLVIVPGYHPAAIDVPPQMPGGTIDVALHPVPRAADATRRIVLDIRDRDSGEAVSGALVLVRPISAGADAPDVWWGIGDTVDGLPDEPVDVLVLRGGYSPALSAGLRPAPPETATRHAVTLVPSRSRIAGRIIDAATGEPVSGVLVTMLHDGPVHPLRSMPAARASGGWARSRPDGFAIDVPAGVARLSVSRSDYAPREVVVSAPSNALDIRLDRPPGAEPAPVFSASFVDAVTGLPIPECEWEARVPGQEASLARGQGSTAVVDAAPSTLHVVVRAAGYATRECALARTENVRIALDPLSR